MGGIPLEIKVWTIGDAAGYVIARGRLEIIMNSGYIRELVIQETKRLAFITNADLYIDGIYTPPSLAPDRRAK